MITRDPKACLRRLFAAAVDAVDPLYCVPPHLPLRPRGRTIVVGAGKASARMARAVEAHWDGPLQGLVATRYGHGERCERIEIVESGHPVPDERGVDVAARIMRLVQGLGPDDLVIALMSGGGSSVVTLPAPGLTMDDLKQVNRALLACGAPIDEMNDVRKELSSISGGRLAQACGAATVVTLVISDVPGDDPAVVASGPTVPSRRDPERARAILGRYGIPVPARVADHLKHPRVVDLQASGAREVKVIARADDALAAAVAQASEEGIEVFNLGGAVAGESRDVARQHAGLVRGLRTVPGARPRLLLSGGETTVTVRGRGRGGRNAEYLLALALALGEEPGVHALACDTDGIDGVEDNAGGIIDPGSLRLALAGGSDPAALLDDNDAHAFLSAAQGLIITGPTRTNVNDFRAVLVDH